ncbi:BQ2448_7332 [Microbotryum intermedium]|uniref:Phosphatidylserine decarboxylase proenzyme 2 n=1 Tax=Microbotryum intermedium TaxID=269621 RepID=A0A238FQN4_9BASI|nr:BQ2448_7332 [Microbotryum intermedium]
MTRQPAVPIVYVAAGDIADHPPTPPSTLASAAPRPQPSHSPSAKSASTAAADSSSSNINSNNTATTSNSNTLSPSDATRPSLASQPSRRSFLGKLNLSPASKLKKAIPAPRIPFRGAARRRNELYEPLDENPLGLLVVRVLAARDIVAKDRNGLSDPFPSLRYMNTRASLFRCETQKLQPATGPTVHKSLNPIWGIGGDQVHIEGIGGEAKLETVLYECKALARERVEIVLWDRDRVGREYLGEVNLGIDDWWGSPQDWVGGRPPVAIEDENNKPVWHQLRSSRSRSHVSGSVLIQVGFKPAPSSSQVVNAIRLATTSTSALNLSRRLNSVEQERILTVLQRCKEDRDAASKADRLLLASPTEGVGTQMISDSAPLGMVPANLHHLFGPSEGGEGDQGALSDTDTASTMTSATEGTDFTDAEYEDVDMGVGDSTEDEDQPVFTAVEAPVDYFGLGGSVGARLTKTRSPESTLVAPESLSALGADERSEAPTPSSSKLDADTPPLSSVAASAPPSRPSSRRGLSLPAFIKRIDSAISHRVHQDGHDSSAGGGAVASDATTDAGDSTSEVPVEKRKRFIRRKTNTEDSITSSGTSTPALALADADALPAVRTPGIGGETKARQVRRLRRRRHENEEADDGQGAEKNSKKVQGLGRRRTRRDYTYEENDDIFGLVQVEVKGAKDLPRYKNLIKSSFDMDPFVVCSFGRRVFRTRVIRHSLNPVWDERLAFNVRQTEVHWTIAFSVYDWDKMSSNDHVGDVAIPLENLLGSTIQPGEDGLFPARADGRLANDDFREHTLKIEVSKEHAERESTTAHPTLQIRAKFTPYAALRQQFWRLYLKNFDSNDSNAYSHLEIASMLDSLGSTLTKDTIASFFTRFDVDLDGELSTDQVVLCLEQEMTRPKEERRAVDEGTDSRSSTPGLSQGSYNANELAVISFASTKHPVAQSSDPSSDMRPVTPGTEIVTNKELGTTVKAPQGREGGRIVSRQTSMASSESSSPALGASTPMLQSNDYATSKDRPVERVINVRQCPLCHAPRMNSKAELDIITHLGICSSTDPRSVNRIVVAEYVTAHQAQRKWLSKAIARATRGAYKIGADSANIIVLDRQTGNLIEEKIAIYVRLGMRLAYRGLGASGGMEGARIARLLDSMSKKQGVKYDSPASVRDIPPFIDFHNLNLDEVRDPLSSFKTFNEFFYRKLKPEARPVAEPDDPTVLVSPADCRAMFFPTVKAATKIWIKGREFSVARLIGDQLQHKAHEFENASLAIFRLAPQDYHRYHSPVDGVMGPQYLVPGKLFTVNPMAIRSAIDVYGENKRLVGTVLSPVFGEVITVWIGAMLVGSIAMTAKEGQKVKRGDETGYFAFGGSTIVCLFNNVQFDEDLVSNSSNSIETLVRMGSRIGKKI